MRLCRLWTKSVNSERHFYLEVVVVVVVDDDLLHVSEILLLFKNCMFLLSRSFPR